MLRWHGLARPDRRDAVRATPPSPTRAGTAWKKLDRAAAAAATSGAGTWPARARATCSTASRFGGAGAQPARRSASVYVPQNQRARVTELTLADAPAASERWRRDQRAGGSGTSARASHSAVLQAALEGREPRRRRSGLPAGVPRGERGGVAAAGRARSADQKPDTTGTPRRSPTANYVVRVTAPTSASQPRDRALTRRFESAPLLVDNRKPEVVGAGRQYPFVSGAARARRPAAPSPQIEFAVDGGDWQLVPPSDGICDDLVEAVHASLPALPRGPAHGDRARLGRRRQRRRGVNHGARRQ